LKSLDPVEPPNRYQWGEPGDLLHLDTKRLGRIDGIGHRITGQRTRPAQKGWEFVFVCIDDATRLAYVEVLDDQLSTTAVGFLGRALSWLRAHGVETKRVMTDNGSCFVCHTFRRFCASLGLRQIYTKPYRPRTNGKAERFIQTLLRSWAYRFAFYTSAERTAFLPRFLHFYNHHRAHSSLDGSPPISRLSRNNVLRLDS
jgi:transposase InsO family protein